jgi:uncharacterized ferritin-like protein (DUF455 family)
VRSIQDEALRILLAESLAEKLRFADDAVDHPATTTGVLPASPARPPELRFASTLASRRTAGFPTDPDSLHDPAVRGRALHHFANHELLALEIMALMILRFVDAPAAFRRGLVRTLREEQRHLRLYVSRMEELGTSFGDHTVNGFFWNIFKEVDSPEAYLSGMALTFEQANLDYSLYFAEQFEGAGDEESARVMREVHSDETRHVKFGKVWMDKLTRVDQPLFDRYQKALPPPLTPQRARGIGFDESGRRSAGLPRAFVERIRASEHGKGRKPVLWRFNAQWEYELANEAVPAVAYTIANDLAPLLALVVPPGDWVEAPEPDPAHRSRLVDAGLRPAEHVGRPASVEPNQVREVRWWADTLPQLASKAFAHDLTPEITEAFRNDPLVHPGDFGAVHTRFDAVELAADDHIVRLKRLFGSAGRGQRVLRERPTSADHRWISRALRRDGAVVVEPELERVLELGVLLDLARKDPFLGALAQICRPNGTFLGHVLGDPVRCLTKEDLRVLGGGKGLSDRLRAAARVVASRLKAAGHRGRAGFDAMLYRRPSEPAPELALRPVVEVNPRTTFGHVAWSLHRHVAPRSWAVHRLGPKDEAPADDMPPLQKDSHGRWTEGVLATTDASRAERFAAWVEVQPRSP